MGLKAVPGRSEPRVGLVLGAGGVLGAAWMTGALPALQERLPRPLGDLDLIVGTSAGSVLAAALRCGIGINEMVAHQRGEAVGPLEASAVDGLTDGPWPPAPQLRLGSARLMLAMVTAPHRVHPGVLASAWLPLGRANHGPLRDMVHALHCHAYGLPVSAEPPAWVRGETWIVAVDYRSGRRAVFGRPGAPPARLPDAVVASCSIPGWYQPKVIGERRYVDGGVRSSTSLDLLVRADLDDVYVLAPMASYAPDAPRHPALRAERFVRQLITRAMAREVSAVRASGATVTVITPGPEDLAAMGHNLMDHGRRRRVLEQSLVTSQARLRSHDGGGWAA